jgi:uncharacterized membrane protein YtjA (UPF0391 family)
VHLPPSLQSDAKSLKAEGNPARKGVARGVRHRFGSAVVLRSTLNASEVVMLYYAVVFFVIALVAALFGFGGIAAGAAGIAKILFFAFLIIAIVTFLMSLARK